MEVTARMLRLNDAISVSRSTIVNTPNDILTFLKSFQFVELSKNMLADSFVRL
jgi:hypothetical protein